MAIRKIKITCVTCIVFLLDSIKIRWSTPCRDCILHTFSYHLIMKPRRILWGLPGDRLPSLLPASYL